MSESQHPVVRNSGEPPEPLPLWKHPWITALSAFHGYYAELFSIVWSETRRFFGWNKRTLLVPVLFVVGFIIALSTIDGNVVRDHLLTTFAFTLAPVGSLAVLITLVNIARAPYLLHAEQRTANELISNGLSEKLQEADRRHEQLVQGLEEQQKAANHYKRQNQINCEEMETLRGSNATLSQKISELEARFLPELTIVYNKDGEHYFQEYSGIRQYRVAAVSTVAVNDAELVANQVVLSDDVLNVRHSRLHMRPMHDRNERGTRRVTMKPFEYEFWDVVSEDGNRVWLNHIESIGQAFLSPGSYEFELRITGGSKTAASSIVKVVVSPDHKVAKFSVYPGRLSDRDSRAEGLTLSLD